MSLIEQAKDELKLINFGDQDSVVMIDLLERFFDQWDSVGAVWAVAPILQRLIAGKPLSPLIGDDSEWLEVGHDLLQNRRCSTVFKDKLTGRCYDIDAGDITFPYEPQKAEVGSPVIEIEVGE